MMAEQSSKVKRGFVKQVLSGDSIVLQGPANNGPPKEITVYLANVNAPRLAKRPNKDGEMLSSDEPYAWEAREFLRKRIVGKTVVFVNEFIATSGREHGRIYLGGTNASDSENISETGVIEGWLEVKPGKQTDENTQKLLDLQEKAKSAKKGRWSDDDNSKHIRNIKWNIDDPRALVDHYKQKPIEAVVEQVRDGSTVRAFLMPTFEYVTVMFSGVKAPSVRIGAEGKVEEYGEQAKYFVESRLLQRDVKIVLEGVSNQNFTGTILHPHGNIAVYLLKEGLAKCVEWSIGQATGGPTQLRDAERYAKERRLRLWKLYVGGPAVDKKTITAKVIEVGLGDTLTLSKENGEELKVYLSSFKPPRREGSGQSENVSRQFRPLYDIPFMFEAREYLRKRLVGKVVTVTLDYLQPKSDQYPEKQFATVMHNNTNVSEGLLSRGLGKVIRHKQDDDGRSPHYDALLAAEAQAEKDKKGLWAEKTDNAKHTVRVQELQGDLQRSKQFMPYLQRSMRSEGIVDFVSSGSRLRIYIPKETCIITFLLGGVSCPRGARVGPEGKAIGESEPFADQAYNFTKHKCLQHDVQVEVESMDKSGGFIGYLFYQNDKGLYVNLSEQLVENGLATVHFSAERSPHFNALQAAETRAKQAKKCLWANYVDKDVEAEKQTQINSAERKINYKKVVVTEVLPGLRFAAQTFDDGPAIEKLMSELQSELKSNALQSTPRRGQLAVAKFENLWHRVRIEGIKADKADIIYIDFGNRETLHVSELFVLPAPLQSLAPGCKEYQLAFVIEPNDANYARDTKEIFQRYAFAYPHLLLNVEYKAENIEAVTLYGEDGDEKIDIGKALIENGNALVERRREARFQTLISEYVQAENVAHSGRRNIWKYGDFTGNDI